MTLGWVIALAASAITASPASARPSPPAPPGDLAVLDIPYVPQSEALCGGAAVAMVLRYWGARGVMAEDFAPLLDADKSGIRVDRLADGVRARGWAAVALAGTEAVAREQLAMRRPVIALVSVGAHRYHYVVIAAWSDRGVIVHDPARAPDRVYRRDDFEQAWGKAHHWMLVITPAAGDPKPGESVSERADPERPIDDDPVVRPAAPPTRCDTLVANAIAQADATAVEHLLTDAVAECPGSAGARRELAGYRLTHGSPAAAAALAADAVRLDAGDAHAWYLLGAARYLTRHPAGALDAWNRIGEPRLDLVNVQGLARSSYRSVAEVVDIAHGELITRDELARARRRLEDLPGVAASRVELQARGEGLAQIDIGVVERSTVPRSTTELLAAGARAAVDREVSETVANLNGSGDAWSASWRWWEDRPRVAFGLAAPALFGTHAVWGVDGSWEAQSYAGGNGPVRRERTRASLSASDWLAPTLKWRAASGIDRWIGLGAFWFGSADLARHSTDDRAVVSVGATLWSGSSRFAQVHADSSWMSRTAAQEWRLLVSGGASLATAGAPLDVWEGAGVGHARAPLLRAHPLLDGGIITGPAFGRGLEHGTVSLERWPTAPRLWSIGVAGFVDVAAVQHRLAAARDAPSIASDLGWFADLGTGLRLRAAWLPGLVRVDYAHGMRDGADAVSVGWQVK